MEYLIVEFEENHFSGEIVPELTALIDAGLIRIVDLVFVARGDDGSVIVMEVDEHEHLSAYAALEGGVGGVLGPEDIDHAVESVANGSSVLILVWEDLWAEGVTGALQRAGGSVVEGARIPAALAQTLESVLAEAS
jgi:uncharacterized membrane protein